MSNLEVTKCYQQFKVGQFLQFLSKQLLQLWSQVSCLSLKPPLFQINDQLSTFIGFNIFYFISHEKRLDRANVQCPTYWLYMYQDDHLHTQHSHSHTLTRDSHCHQRDTMLSQIIDIINYITNTQWKSATIR